MKSAVGETRRVQLQEPRVAIAGLARRSPRSCRRRERRRSVRPPWLRPASRCAAAAARGPAARRRCGCEARSRMSPIAIVAASRNASGPGVGAPGTPPRGSATSPRRSISRSAAAPPRRRRRRESPRRIAEGVVDRARRVDERARRAARERTGEVARLGALRADPRQQHDRLRHQLARLADRARMRRADDRADRREAALADELGAPLADERGDVLPDRPAVGERQVLDLAAGVRGLDDAEDPGAVAARGGEVGLDRVAPEPRVDGERVGERLVALEVGGGVGARGRADVAALAVGDHEQPGAAGVGADLGEARPCRRRRAPRRRRAAA